LKNGIYIVATPIGNLQDISFRAIEVLKNVDIIACEDTRVTKKLFGLLGLPSNKEFIRCDDNTENKHSDQLISLIRSGKSVALVSDAGSPLISDPGYKIIRRCRQENIDIYTIPGPCAVICALQLSGLPTNSFMFAGFIPNKEKARKDLFLKLAEIDTTLVFYETANRILKTLKAATDIFNNREIAVAREITKMYEECICGGIDDVIQHFSLREPKGEFVLMISPPSKEDKKININVEEMLRTKLSEGSLKTAVKELSDRYGLNKKELYNMALKLKDE